MRDHSFVDLVHIVHQPAKFDGAEVSADREPRFMLQGGNDMNVNLLCEAIQNTQELKNITYSNRWK